MLSMILMGLALDAAPVQGKPAPAADKKVCRSQVATGSVMGHKVCHSRTEWAAIDGNDKRNRDNFRDSTTNPGLPSLSGRGL